MADIIDLDLSQTVVDTLGIEFTECTKKMVVATMPVTSITHQPFGIMHGGVSLVLAETVASGGSLQFIDTDTQKVVGQEINANHIRSVSSGVVKAIGMPVHVGKKTIIWDVRIYDEAANIICMSRCTVAIINESTPCTYM